MRLLLLLRRQQQQQHRHSHHRMPYCHVQRRYHHSYPPYRVRVTVVSELALHYSIVQVVGAIPVVAFMRVVVAVVVVTVVVVVVVVVVLTATVPMITTTIVKIVISAEPMYHRCYHRHYVSGRRVISMRSNHPYRHRYSLPPITTMMYTTIRMINVVPVV